MAANGLTNSRLSISPKRTASIRKQPPSSLRSWIDSRSSFSITRQKSAMPTQDCQQCPHCHQTTTDAGNMSSSKGRTSSNNIRSKTSLHEALTSIPYSHIREEAHPTPMRRIPKPKALNPSIRSLSFLPFKKRDPKMDLWSRKFSRAPERPTRPPIEQCPPEQENLADDRRFDQQLMDVQVEQEIPEPACNSSHVRCGIASGTINALKDLRLTVTQDSPSCNAHRDLAYSLLTDSEAKMDHKLELANSDQYLSVAMKWADIESHSDTKVMRVIQAPSIWYSQSDSFSSLPTTASKAALKPSPLRLIKEDDVYIEAPPVPLRSQCSSSSVGNKHASEAIGGRSSFWENALVETRARSSSYTTASVYSSDEEEATSSQNRTPPSSPPQFPVRSSSLWQPVSKDAKNHVEENRDELGIIDDIYNMYTETNAVRKGRLEALANDIQDQAAHMSEVGRLPIQNVSRTQTQLAKEGAYSEDAQRLTRAGPDANRQDADVKQWLDFIARGNATDAESDTALPRFQMQPHKHVTQPNTTSQRRGHQLSETPGQAEHHTKAAHRGSRDSKVAAHTESKNRQISCSLLSYLDTTQVEPVLENNNSKSAIRLDELRDQLPALMKDSVKHNQQQDEPKTAKTTHTRSSSASSQYSVSTEATEEMPLKLQKIVIEWKGKRYPVLIGERGKIWEGPCTREGCEKHGRQRSRISYRMI